MLISVIIPAFNEEAYLGETLTSISRAKVRLEREAGLAAEIIVVDNGSEDATAEIAQRFGAIVITESQRNVAKARDSGARASRGDVLIFIDADTTIPDELFVRIAATMSDAACFGGAVDTNYRPRKLAVRVYLQFWRILGKLIGLAQGATQFCHREAFFALNGYDESLFMGEDVDFYWRLKRLARQRNRHVVLIEDSKVIPSTRRLDQWRLSRTLVWTNPLFILLFRRKKTFWHGWYVAAPR
jgi:glycosyltransferase involved in cell wall biosynthesis